MTLCINGEEIAQEDFLSKFKEFYKAVLRYNTITYHNRKGNVYRNQGADRENYLL